MGGERVVSFENTNKDKSPQTKLHQKGQNEVLERGKSEEK